ncbi:MAG: hypothetical protein NUV67_03375 [archaeon]|nr:hypothetical protein [archaeon]
MRPVHKLEVAFKEKKDDSTGFAAKNDIEEDLGIGGLDSIFTSEIYYIDAELAAQKILEIAENVFIDPLIQKFSLKGNVHSGAKNFVEVKLHPDVTDNLGIVAKEAIEDYLGKPLEGNIRTSRKYYLYGDIDAKAAKRIAKELLANEAIETFEVGK